MIITLNGKNFSQDALEDNCIGFFKVYRKNSIRLYNAAGDYIAAINSEGVLCNASHVLPNGKIWYSHATVKEIGEWESYLQSHDDRHGALRSLGLRIKYS